MPRDKPLLRFALRFVVAFALLALPWPHWYDAWQAATRTIVTHTLAGSSGTREVNVTTPEATPHGADFRLEIVNRGLMNPDGSGPVRNLDLNVAQIEMRPFALLFALFFATPIPWKRRVRFLAVGAVLLQVGILATLSICIWRESMELLLVNATSTEKAVATAMKEGLIQYFGLVMPFVLWLLLCGRASGVWQSPFATTNEEETLGKLKQA